MSSTHGRSGARHQWLRGFCQGTGVGTGQGSVAAETFRLLQQQGPIEHLRVLVLLAHRRPQLGSTGPPLLQRFLEQQPDWIEWLLPVLSDSAR